MFLHQTVIGNKVYAYLWEKKYSSHRPPPNPPTPTPYHHHISLGDIPVLVNEIA